MKYFIFVTILLAVMNGWRFNFINNNMIKLSKSI